VNDQLTVGATATLTQVITTDDIARFADVTGDTNPLHVEDEFARRHGFRGAIAHGMLVAGQISRALGTFLPGPGSIYLGQTLSFKAPVYAGDRITVTVTVVHVRPDKPIATLTTTCRNQHGELVIDGEAVVLHRATR
jgi:3-hydroxybutyryl-CoA dehydratase